MPLTNDSSENIRTLMHEKKGLKGWPRKRIVAAGIHAAETRMGPKHMMKAKSLHPKRKRTPSNPSYRVSKKHTYGG